jgi:drug/metabolite transporter (DMT)-like permease
MPADMSTSASSFKADALLVIVTVLAAAGWLFSHQALLQITPLWFIAIRFSLGALVLGVFAHRSLGHMTAQHWRHGVVVGGWFAAGMVLWILGLAHSQHLGEGAFLTSLGVVLVPIVGRIAFGERPHSHVWWAACVALLGLLCLMAQHGVRIDPSQLWFVGAAVLFAVYFQLNARMAQQIPVIALTSIALGCVSVTAASLAYVIEPIPDFITPATWGWIWASVLLATCLRFALQTKAQQLSNASHAALLMTLEPLWTALLGFVWLGQSLSLLQLVGCALIFMALVVGRLPRRTVEVGA